MPTLDWLNRAAAFTTAAKVPYRLLEQVSVHTSSALSPENTTNLIAYQAINTPARGQNSPQNGINHDNLLIQGDNLEALKALLPFYRGQVKCIFIDPPYNTKSAFEHYDDNLEHAQWLSMMLPRLQLLRELLREDGSIWVTIDDNEGHYLKVMMDEVFGRGNFVANVVWEKSDSPKMDSLQFSTRHDHLLVTCKNASSFTLKRLDTEMASHYDKVDENGRNYYLKPLRAMGGQGDSREARPNLYYPLIAPDGSEVFPKRTDGKDGAWRWSRIKVAEEASRIEWRSGKNGWSAYFRIFADQNTGRPSETIWTHSDVGSNRTSKAEVKAFFDDAGAFTTPKPEALIKRVLELATNEGDLVLDSFLGSGTTAAVAHKMGRRWIGIEMGEHAATHCLPRLQKVLDGEQGGISKALNWNGGGGFRFMRLGETMFDDRGRINPAVRFATLAAFIWQQETNTALDLAASVPATPHLGTHYKFNSYLGNKYAGYNQNKPQNDDFEANLGAPLAEKGLFDAPSDEVANETAETSESPETSVIPEIQSGTAYYLLFNGILKDKRPASGNVLTREVLAALLDLHAKVLADAPEGAELDLMVYGEACRLGEERLKQAKVTFKHIPYDVRAR